MAKIETIVKRACQLAGVVTSDDDSVPADYATPVFELLKDLVAQLNVQAEISFGVRKDTLTVNGDKVTFLASGTPAADTVIGFVPLIAPRVIIDKTSLTLSSIDTVLTREASDITVFAFNVANGYSELLFAGPVAKSATIISNTPLTIDVSPAGNVNVPDSYVSYMTMALAVDVARFYQFDEKIAILSAKEQSLKTDIAANNVAQAPIRQNLSLALAKYA